MTSQLFVVFLTFLHMGKMAQTASVKNSSSVHQETSFVSAERGSNLTLRCFYDGGVAARYYWFKQALGQRLRLISTFYTYDGHSFFNEFKNNSRFRLDTASGKNHLMVQNLQISDSATYYCISCFLNRIEISQAITVSVKDSSRNIQASVLQSESDIIQPGGSLTLNCTVHTGSCDGGHSVYWFKDSEESHPGLIYTHGDRNDQCERKPDTQTHTCVYSLPMTNLNRFHTGTYYCAVVSCGHILFGNGTKLDFEGEEDSPVLMYFMSGALAFTTVLVVALTFIICKMNKTNSLLSESQAGSSSTSRADAEGHQHAVKLYYAALSINLNNWSSGQRDGTWSGCVYHRMTE